MFTNDLLHERLSTLEYIFLKITKNSCNLLSFESYDRLLDFLKYDLNCFNSNGIYTINSLETENINEGTILLIENLDTNKITYKTTISEEIFDTKVELIDYLVNEKNISQINSTLEPNNIIPHINNINSQDTKIDENIYEAHDEEDFKFYTKVLAIDFETANEFHDKACSVGISLFENGEIKLNDEFLINPETYFNDRNIAVHGITKNMVENCDTFPCIWDILSKYIDEDTLIIAHNANFDIRLLKKLIAIYKCDYKDFEYLCTQKLYKKNVVLDSYNLKALANHLNEEFNHHKALDDSLICLKAFINLLDGRKIFSKDFIENKLNTPIEHFTLSDLDKSYKAKERKNSNFRNFSNEFKAKDLKPQTNNFDKNHPVYGKIFVFTGELPSFDSKQEAAQKVVNLGGIYKDSVVKAINYLVQGTDLQTNQPMEGTKIKKVLDYNNKGCEINIISEYEFMNMVNTDSNIKTDLVDLSISSEEDDNYDYYNDIIDTQNQIDDEKTEEIIINTENEAKEVTENTKTKLKIPKSFKKTNNTQISLFDMFDTTDDSIIEEVAPIIEETKEILDTTLETISQSFISPKKEFKSFDSLDEALEKLKQFKLVGAKAKSIDKSIYYKGVYSSNTTECEVVGYVNDDILVIKILNNLHCIRAEYLKQMQDANFSNFDS